MYDDAQRLLGYQGIVELVELCGFYTLLSYVLNALEVPLPVGPRPSGVTRSRTCGRTGRDRVPRWTRPDGTALACLAFLAGVPASEAVAWVRERYRSKAVETPGQQAFVEAFA